MHFATQTLSRAAVVASAQAGAKKLFARPRCADPPKLARLRAAMATPENIDLTDEFQRFIQTHESIYRYLSESYNRDRVVLHFQAVYSASKQAEAPPYLIRFTLVDINAIGHITFTQLFQIVK